MSRGNGNSAPGAGRVGRLRIGMIDIAAVHHCRDGVQRFRDRHPELDVSFRMTVAYDGTGFHGFAEAAAVPTVMGVLRDAVETIVRQPVDLVGAGSLNIESRAIDARADLSLSEELSAQAGTDLARFTREGSRIVLPARVGGTTDRPRVVIDAVAATKRGLRNEVQRRLGGILGGLRAP